MENTTAHAAPPRTRPVTVIAQDPSVRDPNRASRRQIIRATVDVPTEHLEVGPEGYRAKVVDYSVTEKVFWKAHKLRPDRDDFADMTDRQLLEDPRFHCQNAYAFVMRTIARFEFALGRRVSWAFNGHQLNIVPHAFADANAFYSRDDQALLFGYFPSASDRRMIFTCLSHDVVVHETTHALLDGLRERYMDPSSPDQAAFHEGFADIVALLSVFSMRDVVARVIDLALRDEPAGSTIRRSAIAVGRLRTSGLMGLAEEMGELAVIRGSALRRSVDDLWPPSPRYYREDPEFEESHRRGEILVAAVMNAFLETWVERLHDPEEVRGRFVGRARVVEEGAEIADTLLTLVIRALDYTPPVHLLFSDFLSAALTSDAAVRPDDGKYNLRARLLDSFHAYGIEPAGGRTEDGRSETEGHWVLAPGGLDYGRTHFEPMRTDADEVFRFLWENRKRLDISGQVYSRVLSVRPSVRIGPDGFVLREVVAEHIQVLKTTAGELRNHNLIESPAGMPSDTPITLQGGGTLIFDEYGQLKYHVHNELLNRTRQSARLRYQWESGDFRKDRTLRRQFSSRHRWRASGGPRPHEEW